MYALHDPAKSDTGDQLSTAASCYEATSDLERQAFRITYYFAAVRRIVLLTVLRKQRMNERHEVHRARDAMARCLREGHSAEEDND